MEYLYNGVRLPKLPVVEGYPYQYLFVRATDNAYCFMADTIPKKVSTKGGLLQYGSGTRFVLIDGEWVSYSTTQGGKIIWANTDVYYMDSVADVGGTLYLAASEPVPILAPTIDPLSMWMGWKAGNWVARQRGKKVEQPVAYLYNGVRLPGLPEWDKTVYPFAFIVVGDTTELIVSQYSLRVYDVFGVLNFGWHDPDTGSNYNSSEILTYTLLDGRWGEPISDTTTPNKEWDIVWTNTDIPDTRNNTVFLAAFDPVPVYE